MQSFVSGFTWILDVKRCFPILHNVSIDSFYTSNFYSESAHFPLTLQHGYNILVTNKFQVAENVFNMMWWFLLDRVLPYEYITFLRIWPTSPFNTRNIIKKDYILMLSLLCPIFLIPVLDHPLLLLYHTLHGTHQYRKGYCFTRFFPFHFCNNNLASCLA